MAGSALSRNAVYLTALLNKEDNIRNLISDPFT